MKFFDLPSGFGILISNEESVLIDKIKQNQGSMAKKSLDTREQMVAAGLVAKDVLTRTRRDGKLYYTIAAVDQIWRI